MVDRLTNSDIDRIYRRITTQIDLSNINNKTQFDNAIRNNSRNRFWNMKLNDFFWDIHKSREKVLEEVPEIVDIPMPTTPQIKRIITIRTRKNIINVLPSERQRGYERQKGRFWTDNEIKFAQRLKKDGLIYKQIANQLNRTPSSVSTKLSRVNKLK